MNDYKEGGGGERERAACALASQKNGRKAGLETSERGRIRHTRVQNGSIKQRVRRV